MPLYSYRKADVKLEPGKYILKHQDSFTATSKKKVTMWDVMVGARNDFHKLMTTSKLAASIIPTLLIAAGAFIIYKQVWPTVVQTVQDKTGYFDQGGGALVAGSYIEAKQSYSNPGAKYFAELKNSAQEQKLLFNDKKSQDYSGNFSLSMPSLGIKDLKVKGNVDSSVEEVYRRELTDAVGHFEGTSLPFTDLDTYNSVIYGHSADGDYYDRTKDPAASFSRLSELRYGAEIIVKLEGKEYKYKFTRGKIVNANDLSILEGNKGQKTLTLFTCYPNGNNSKRFVATAKLEE